ncbi:MAG: hypothetical protein WA824_10995 [Candidatus Sulfotelmatobacter sp.]
MNKVSRRKFVITGLAATAGVSGLAVAANMAQRYGLVPRRIAEESMVQAKPSPTPHSGFLRDIRWPGSFLAA